MKSVITEVLENETRKYSTNSLGYKRVMQEQKVFKFLEGCSYIPGVIKMESSAAEASIVMNTLKGKSLREILGVRDEFTIKPVSWKYAKQILQQYVEAEMDLLNRGALYRDMNLDHIVFLDDRAYLVDLESTLTNVNHSNWTLKDMRGTWETMAVEEFSGYGELSARTATYRVAAIAYIILVGSLPFKRFPHSRSKTHRWRSRHPIEIDERLSKDVRRVFKVGMARKPMHRHKDPKSFLKQLEKAYGYR